MKTIIGKMRDPVSSLTHMLFMVLSIPLTAVMVHLAMQENAIKGTAAFFIFGASIFLLYAASTIYHALSVRENVILVLKKIDHMMIFILIAGTYTPVCLLTLPHNWGIVMLCMIWSLTLGGIIMKAVWIHAPRWLYTSVYLAMGWLIVIAFYPLSRVVEWTGIVVLAAGGVAYTAGAVIYGLKRPKLKCKMFGFHEIFHVFVMLGTTLHVLFMFGWII